MNDMRLSGGAALGTRDRYRPLLGLSKRRESTENDSPSNTGAARVWTAWLSPDSYLMK